MTIEAKKRKLYDLIDNQTRRIEELKRIFSRIKSFREMIERDTDEERKASRVSDLKNLQREYENILAEISLFEKERRELGKEYLDLLTTE